MRANATSCRSEFDVIPPTPVFDADGNASIRFAIPKSAIGLLALCYKFNYHTVGASPTAYLLFPDIRAASVAFRKVSPQGTALGCVSNITLDGAGFDALIGLSKAGLAPEPTCRFGGVGSTIATIVNDTQIVCQTIAPVVAATLPLHIDIGIITALLPAAFPSFVAYDSSLHVITSMYPAGGAYRDERPLRLHGFTFADVGTPRCRHGNLTSFAPAVVVNATFATCLKPRFPDSVRDEVGPYVVSFSANGQCFPESSAGAKFYLYNSQVRFLQVTGAPTMSVSVLDIIGDGFVAPALDGGACRFRRTAPLWASSNVVETPLTTISSTLVRCHGPASHVPGSWKVEVLLNGEEVLPSSEGDLVFREYSRAAVILQALVPPGAPVSEATTLTIHGTNFASYGEGQLVCRAWAAANGLPQPGDVGILSTASLLDATRMRCRLAASASVGITYVSLSLNNGTLASLITEWLPFRHYRQPNVTAVIPTEADAEGGTVVAVYGSGFSALSASTELQSSFLRVRFGSLGVAVPPVSLTDSVITLRSPYGSGSARVQVALDSRTFSNLPVAPVFTFKGLYAPALVGASFDRDGATTLIIRFDEQPTNRAGMIGIGPCSAVLDDTTSSQLQGTSAESVPSSCYWADDSTLVAQLTMHTLAAAGMRVGIRSNVLWPKAWDAPTAPASRSCSLPSSKCASGSTTVGLDFPCDSPHTSEIELCARPTAIIMASRSISRCPGTSLKLDGSRSMGGGARPLTYRWSALPRSCDNFPMISSFLAQLPSSAETVTLEASILSGGARFDLQLVVTNFLGADSPPTLVSVHRAAAAIPTVFINAPPLLIFPSSGAVRLASNAIIAP